MIAADKKKMLDDTLAKAQDLCDLRKHFFHKWLTEHFGFNEYQRILAYLSTLDAKGVAFETGVIEAEYQWCLEAPPGEFEKLWE